MKVSILLFVFVLVLCVALSHQTQRCIYSREDHVVCEYKNKNLERAGNNEYSVHHTKLKTPNGYPRCNVRAMDQFKAEITDLGTEEMRIMYSPGFVFGEQYENELRAEYLVQCEPDELAFFNITYLNLQGRDCQDDDKFDRCQDYVEIVRDFFGVTEECGNTTSPTGVLELEFGNFTVVFRTSEEVRGEGFQMYSLCFKPAERFLQNCLQVSEFSSDVCTANEGVGTESPPSETKRSAEEDRVYLYGEEVATCYSDLFPGYPANLRMAKDLAKFHHQWNRLSGTMEVMEVNVLYNQTVSYLDNIILIADRLTGKILARYGGVEALLTFDSNGAIKKHVGQVDERKPHFYGAGPLRIVDHRAYFQLFVIDPRGLVPNAKEEIELLAMNSPLLSSIHKEYDRPSEVPRRGRRTTDSQLTDEDRDAVLAALRNKESCNAVLRAQSRATLTYYSEIDSSFVDDLRNFDISCVLSGNFLSCTTDSTTLPGRTMCQVDSQAPSHCEPFSGQFDLSTVNTPTESVTVTAINCDGQTAVALITDV